MAFERPTLSELIERITADYKSRLEIEGALVRRSMVEVMSMVWSGATHLLHGHLAWLAKQLFADLSERDFLIRDASQYDLAPTPATFASGTVVATGTPTTAIPEDTILVSQTTAARYRVTDATVIGGGGDVNVFVEAEIAGEDGNLAEGEVLVFESPIAGVDSEAEVDEDGIEGGADEEDTEDFRTRFLERLREPPQGGNDHDYIAWAKTVSGVTRAWVYPHESGLGTLTVRFVLDDREDPIPLAEDVEDVEAAIEAERPTTAEVTVEAPVALPVPFDITLTPNTAEVQSAVQAEIEDLFRREAEPGDEDGRGTILFSQMNVAIGIAAGVEDFTLNSPSADVVPAVGELATVDDFTWS
jgi:uncharacterized phage protein gp47/JayE